MEDITIIIRSVRERTEELCKKLILNQGIPEEELTIVREVPFSASMRKSFEIGIESKKKWTLCVDADVLSRPGSIAQMIELAEGQKQNISEIQGYILDKFFGGVRRGGFHMYRSSLLLKVLECIPTEGVDIRPETRTLKEMAKRGYPRAVVPYIVGTHDDEQYNFDIYRKAFVQAVKHLDRADLLISHWKKNAETDQDFKVALTAFSDSIRYTGETFINSDQELYTKKFEESGFKEKEELDPNRISLQDIEERVSTWDTDDKYYDHYPNSQGLDNEGKVALRKVKQSIRNRGPVQTTLLMLSQVFTSVGEKLKSRIPE